LDGDHGPLVTLQAGGSRLSPLEFVETLGDLYARKAAAPEALETAYQRFRFLITRRLGLPPSATPERIAASVADRWMFRDPAFLELLKNASAPSICTIFLRSARCGWSGSCMDVPQ
jgi:hypothetical protein